MNFSSNTAVNSFHGTTMSVFQHPEELSIDPSEIVRISDTSGRGKQRPKLPSVYVTLKQTKEVKAEQPKYNKKVL